MRISILFFTINIFIFLLAGGTALGQSIYTVNTEAQLRTGAGLHFKSILTIKSGEKLAVIDTNNAKWLNVEYQQRRGFVSRKLLTVKPDTLKAVTDSVKPGLLPIIVNKSNEQPGFSLMKIILMLGFMFILSYILFSPKKQVPQKKVNKTQHAKTTPEKKIAETVTTKSNSYTQKIKSTVPVLLSSDVPKNLNQNNLPEKQREFYYSLKENFLLESKVDIEGNENYILILLHDLLRDYNTHQNLPYLKSQFQQIDIWYPFMKKYTSQELEKLAQLHKSPKQTTQSGSSLNDHNGTYPPVNSEESSNNAEIQDDSTIDVNIQKFETSIPSNITFQSQNIAPHWQHTYIYSYNELLHATKEQQRFYNIYKQSFLNNIFLDIQGNNNYAFILLFDFLNEYDKKENLSHLKSHLQKLGQQYPVTQRYALKFFADRAKSYTADPKVSTELLQYEPDSRYANDFNLEATYWPLGTRYKVKLELTKKETILLNKIGTVSNTFIDIEWCCKETIKLFLKTVKALNQDYIQKESSFEKEIDTLATQVSLKHFQYKTYSNNLSYFVDSIKNEILITIFKICENTVRGNYNHKRKLSIEYNYYSKDIRETLEANIYTPASLIASSLESEILIPDEETDTKLYTLNSTRWKIKFEQLTKHFDGNAKDFFKEVVNLGLLNIHNNSVEKAFFEGSKFIAPIDCEVALKLYLYYLSYDLKSATFDNKQLTKTVQNNLFKTEGQLEGFKRLVTTFIKDKNLNNALNAVTDLYSIKRKKIHLDTSFIKEVEKQHAGTVELLNEYLYDESDNLEVSLQVTDKNESEIKISVNNGEPVKTSPYLTELLFTRDQIDLLDLFSKNNLNLPNEELEVFARTKNMFAKPLIEGINDQCFEMLDDVLIEEEENEFIINPDYYQTILIK